MFVPQVPQRGGSDYRAEAFSPWGLMPLPARTQNTSALSSVPASSSDRASCFPSSFSSAFSSVPVVYGSNRRTEGILNDGKTGA